MVSDLGQEALRGTVAFAGNAFDVFWVYANPFYFHDGVWLVIGCKDNDFKPKRGDIVAMCDRLFFLRHAEFVNITIGSTFDV